MGRRAKWNKAGWDNCPGVGQPPVRITQEEKLWEYGNHRGGVFAFARGICPVCGADRHLRSGLMGQHKQEDRPMDSQRSATDYMNQALIPTLTAVLANEYPPGSTIVSAHPTAHEVIVVIAIPHKFTRVD